MATARPPPACRPGFGLLPLYDVEEKHQVHVNRLETMLMLNCRHNFSRSGTIDLIHGELGCVISILSLFLTRLYARTHVDLSNDLSFWQSEPSPYDIIKD